MGGRVMGKVAKVLFPEARETERRPFTEITGVCSCCGALVSRNQYGFDEECPECGADLDWSEE
jgi:predicted amidophosphoribosyltransferase